MPYTLNMPITVYTQVEYKNIEDKYNEVKYMLSDIIRELQNHCCNMRPGHEEIKKLIPPSLLKWHNENDDRL